MIGCKMHPAGVVCIDGGHLFGSLSPPFCPSFLPSYNVIDGPIKGALLANSTPSKVTHGGLVGQLYFGAPQRIEMSTTSPCSGYCIVAAIKLSD